MCDSTAPVLDSTTPGLGLNDAAVNTTTSVQVSRLHRILWLLCLEVRHRLEEIYGDTRGSGGGDVSGRRASEVAGDCGGELELPS